MQLCMHASWTFQDELLSAVYSQLINSLRLQLDIFDCRRYSCLPVAVQVWVSKDKCKKCCAGLKGQRQLYYSQLTVHFPESNLRIILKFAYQFIIVVPHRNFLAKRKRNIQALKQKHWQKSVASYSHSFQKRCSYVAMYLTRDKYCIWQHSL